MVKDMTKGPPLKLILNFMLPLLLGNLIQQLYYLIDSVFVSVFVGPQSLAGLGVSSSIFFVVLGIVYGGCGGFGIIMAQKFGAKRKKGIKFAVAASLHLCVIFTIAITIAGLILTKPLLVFTKTPESVFNHAYIYTIITFAGTFSEIAYVLFAVILKSVGNNKTPLLFLVFCSVLDGILDYIMICIFNLSTAGAALATVIAQTVSAILCLILIIKKYKFLWPKKNEWKFKKHYFLAELKIGSPMGLQFAITGIGIIFVQKAIDSFGENAIAGFTIAMKIEDLVLTAFFALATAIATFVGQNFGARKYHRIKEGAKAIVIIGLSFCFLFSLIVIVFWDQIINLFAANKNTIPEAVKFEINNKAKQYINIAIFNFPILCLLICFRSLIQAMGKSLIPFLTSFAELLMRLIGALVLAKLFGYVGVCWSPITAWYAAFIMVMASYFYTARKILKSNNKNTIEPNEI